MEYARHFINQVEIRPENADEIGFVMDFVSDAKEVELNVDTVRLSTDGYKQVLNHLQQNGLAVMLPYTIKVGSEIVEYVIDFTKSPVFTDVYCDVKIRKKDAIDKFIEDAGGTSFDLLRHKGVLSSSDKFNVPYIIVKDNQAEMLVMLSITTFSLLNTLQQQIKSLADLVAEALNPFNVLVFVAQTVAQVIYTIAIIIALIDLIKKIMEIVFPRVRNLQACKVKTLLERGCQHLGYAFKSTLLTKYANMTVLPVPLKKDKQSYFDNLFNNNNLPYNTGFPTALDTVKTVWDLFEAMKIMLNAKIRLIGNTIHFERRDFWYSQPATTVVNTLNLQDERLNSWTYNTDEWWKRSYIRYQSDFTDTHTVDKNSTINAEYNADVASVVDPKLKSISGLNDIAIPFAQGTRKTQLNFVEKSARELAAYADSVINLFGGNSDMASKVEGRIGALIISSQYFEVTKLLWTIGGKQPANYDTIIGAPAIYAAEHVINEPENNNYEIRESTIPFSHQNFVNLIGNNVVKDQNGVEMEVLNFTWLIDSTVADIRYKKQSTLPTGITVERIN